MSGRMSQKDRKAYAAVHGWVSECPSGKRGFQSRDAAKRSQKNLRNRGERDLGVYTCDDCQLWHVGHRPHAITQGHLNVDTWQAQKAGRTA